MSVSTNVQNLVEKSSLGQEKMLENLYFKRFFNCYNRILDLIAMKLRILLYHVGVHICTKFDGDIFFRRGEMEDKHVFQTVF